MKMTIQVILGLGPALLLSGCTYATDTMSQPPEIDWTVHESIDINTQVDIMISLHSSEQEELRPISFVLQKQGQTETMEVPFELDDKGIVNIQTSFDEEGIYNLRAKMEAGSQTIQPTRQIVVGEVVSTDGKQAEPTEEGHSHHH